jgi:hypothetical protein
MLTTAGVIFLRIGASDGTVPPLVSMLTTAGVIFLRIGASDGTVPPGEATGEVSTPAARPAVVAVRPSAITANALIIIGLVRGRRSTERSRE